METRSRPAVGRAVVGGAIAGLIASVLMAMFAMIAAATYQDIGFFTPMYHIASTFISGDAMKTSMDRAMQGSDFYFTLGPAVVDGTGVTPPGRDRGRPTRGLNCMTCRRR
jgi:hypothetical protein